MLRALHRAGQIKSGQRFADIGAQVIEPDTRDAVAAILKDFGQELKAEDSVWFQDKPGRKPSAGVLMRRLGFDYAAIDASSEVFATASGQNFDLNFDAVPVTARGTWDFIFENGTFEHACNQRNCFNVAHDLGATGSLRLHALPFLGMYDYHYVTMLPRLYLDLAEANNASIEGMWLVIEGGEVPVQWDGNYEDFDRYALDVSESVFLCLYVLYRKLVHSPFASVALPDDADRQFGYQRATFNILTDSIVQRFIGKPQSIMDIGAQILKVEKADNSVFDFAKLYGDHDEYVSQGDFTLQQLFSQLGIRHAQLPRAEVAVAAAEADARGTWDLVTNLGVMNRDLDVLGQLQATHNLTKVGGHMLFVVAAQGVTTDLYWNIHPSLFEEAAIHNAYEMVAAWIKTTKGDRLSWWDEYSFKKMKVGASGHDDVIYYCVILRKQFDNPFFIPYQSKYRYLRSEQASQRYTVFDGQSIKPDWPIVRWPTRAALAGLDRNNRRREPTAQIFYKDHPFPLAGFRSPQK